MNSYSLIWLKSLSVMPFNDSSNARQLLICLIFWFGFVFEADRQWCLELPNFLPSWTPTDTTNYYFAHPTFSHRLFVCSFMMVVAHKNINAVQAHTPLDNFFHCYFPQLLGNTWVVKWNKSGLRPGK